MLTSRRTRQIPSCPFTHYAVTAVAFALAHTASAGVFYGYCHCPGDVNGDLTVDGADLGIILSAWGPVATSHVADINEDGMVDGADLGIALSSWGACPPPPNDNCQDAIEFGFNTGALQLCTLDATTDGPPVDNCGPFASQIHKDVWFVYHAPGDATVKLNTCSQVEWDTIIAVYGSVLAGLDGCPPQPGQVGIMQPVACNDDYAVCDFNASLVSFEAAAGHIYKVRVGGFAGANGIGTMSVAITSVGAVCDLGIPVTGIDGATQTVFGSTLDNPTAPAPCALQPSQGEWITYIPTCTQEQVYLSTCHPGTDFDTVVAVWKETFECDGFFEVCDDDSDGAACQLDGLPRKSKVDFTAFAGSVYHIRVGGYNPQAAGSYKLTIETDCIVP